MGGALRLLLLSDVFLLLLLPKTELASYQTSIAEEEIPEERAGDEEEPGEHKFPSPWTTFCLLGQNFLHDDIFFPWTTFWNSSQGLRDQEG